MKNSLYHKIISSAIIALCISLLACGDFEEGKGGLVWINPGTFMMGDDDPVTEHAQPAHKVTLTKGFWMSRYQITQEQYYSVMGVTIPDWFKTHGSCLPVDEPTWYQAIVFCNKLSIKEGLTPVYSILGSTNPNSWGVMPDSDSHTNYVTWNAVIWDRGANGYRLPTEAEWEYACRAGTKTTYSFGDSDSVLGNYAWYVNNSDTIGSGTRTQEVGKKLPNAWGLYDMHGNVYEWCWDWYYDYPNPSTPQTYDPSGDVSTNNCRVIRGGSYDAPAKWLRSALRISMKPYGDTNVAFVGFRVVRP